MSNKARGSRMFVIFRAILVAMLFISLWFWLAISVRKYDPLFHVMLPQWLRISGWVLLVSGFVLATSCVALFATRGRGTAAPFDPPQTFVATGPYRFVRNPMYVGAICALLGSGLIANSPSILLLAVGFWMLAHGFVLLYEEPALERRFGNSYVQYRRKVRRWLPRFPQK